MIDITELKAQMVRKKYTQESLANELGISSRTLSNKLKRGVFGSDEIDKMISILEIKEPLKIFFTTTVS
jgi:transcriptional regulator with XRE-family HTH domain